MGDKLTKFLFSLLYMHIQINTIAASVRERTYSLVSFYLCLVESCDTLLSYLATIRFTVFSHTHIMTNWEGKVIVGRLARSSTAYSVTIIFVYYTYINMLIKIVTVTLSKRKYLSLHRKKPLGERRSLQICHCYSITTHLLYT